jgi:hypothetical protein
VNQARIVVQKGESMAIGRISGPMLKANLERLGVDLAFETDLLYLDVANGRIGIKNAAPTVALDVTGSAKFSNNITVDGISNLGNLRVSNNTISATNTDGNIILTPNGTGKVLIGTTSSAGDYILQIAGNVYATGNIVAQGNIQLGDANTDTITFGGEVTSDIYPDLNDTYSLGTASKRWRGQFSRLQVGNISITGNFITNIDTDEDLILTSNGTGAIVLNGDVGVNTNSPVTSFHINATDALLIPSGTSAERPAPGYGGMIRFNTDTGRYEVYDASIWRTLVDSSSTSAPITSVTYTGDGSTTDFAVSLGATQESLIVSINGTVQRPATSYTVSSGTLSFSEAPFPDDKIEVRTLGEKGDLGSIPAINKIVYENFSTTPTVVDRWNKNSFRSAEYNITADDGAGKYHMTRFALLYDGTTIHTIEYAVLAPAGNVMTVSAQINGGYIELILTGVIGTTNKASMIRTLFEI